MESLIHSKAVLESNARRTLGYICGYNINNLKCADKPDLQDVTNSYGIEVVQDCYPNELEGERFIEGIGGRSVSGIQEKQIIKLREFGGTLRVENGIVVGASFIPTPCNPGHLIKTIQKKIDKLNCGGYKQFDEYGLYVFVETIFLFDSYVQSVVTEASAYQREKERKYKTIYLDGYYEMCVCDMELHTFVKKAISKEIREKLT